MMICPILLLIASNGILSGKAGLQISPQSIAYVEENNPLTLTCIASDFSFNVFSWAIKDNVSYSIKLNTYPCEARNTIDPLIYQFSCSGNTFKWTILHVNKQRHNEQWLCIANDVGNTKSSITSIYVQVRVTTVSFLSPTKTNVTVTENILQNFECKTSEERPRSTIQWYISSSSGSSVSLGTGNVTQADNELANTISTLRYSFNRTVSGQQLYCTAFNINGQTTVQSNRKEIIVEYGTNGPPLIDHFTSGSTYKAILLEWQSLVCSVTGGYPTPTLTWNCFNGTVTPWRSAQTVVKKNITWRASTIKASNCTCLSNQKVSGQQASSLNVDVLYPPSSPVFYINTTAVSGMVKVIRNKNIDVKCETFSNPSPTYEWSANVGGQWLRFPNVSKTDEKTFTCTVKNSMVPSEGEKQIKSAQSSFSLEVLSPPGTPIFKVGTRLISSNLSVVKGDNVRVICEATADPSPHIYSWTGQSSGNSILTINDIQTAGTRRCTATNTMTPTVGLNETKSSNALLNIVVMRGPTTPIVSYRSSAGQTTNLTVEKLLVIKGTDFSLICSGSNSIPAPTYRWSGKKTSNTNIISYANIDINDNGQSTCNAENTMVRTVGNTTYGSNSSHVVIEILTQPEVEQFEAQTVVENRPLSVNCTATGNPDPTNYIWTRLQDTFRQTQSTIYIPNTRRDDTDYYTCTARNTMLPTVGGQTDGVGSRTMDVKILYHPDVTVSALNDTTLTETATNVILLCSAKGEPQEYNFSKWIQYAPDGLTKVKEYNSTQIEGGNAYLTFTSLSYMDSGIYHCFVRNGIEDYRTGNITATNSTLQTVTGKPVIINGTEHDIAAAKHENSTLLVDFYTNDGSGPSVKWYKLTADSKYSLSNKEGKMLLETVPKNVSVNYHTVPVLQQGNRTHLLIQNISDSDFGEYEVEIQNSIGNTTWKINLVAQGAPDLPSKFRDISATETSIVLSWKSGFHGGANQIFYIQYKTASSTWQNRTEIIGGLLTDTDFNATVNNLKPGTVHLFRIFAANKYGRSSFSSPIDALTSKSEEPHDGGESITGPAIGGGVGGALVIVAIVFLIVIIRKRREGGGEAGTQKKILLDGNRSKNGVKKNDDREEVPNPIYEPAGAFQSSLNSTQNAGIKNLETTDLYATPMKTKGGKKESPGDLYSVPDKSRGGKKESPGDLYSIPDRNKGKKKEPQTDIYSFPQKDKGKQKHQKKQKEKKQKQKKGKDNLQGNVNEGLVYENADLGAGAGAINTENVYEMTDASDSPKTSRTQNADGLIYLEVDVSRNKDATGNGKVVIHGLDDRSDYADIAFGKVGEQAPESDEEKAKENTNEG